MNDGASAGRIRVVLTGTVANYVGQVVTFGTGFVMTPFILRQVGPSEYGLWLLVGSVLAYGGLLDLGISGAVVKYVAEYRARRQDHLASSLVATALRLYSVLGLTIVLFSLILAPLFSAIFNVSAEQAETARRLVILMGVALGVSIPSATTNAVLRGLQRFDLINVITIAGTLLTAAATVVVLLRGGGVTAMVAVGIPISLAMQLPTLLFIRRTAPDLRMSLRGASRQHVRTVLSFSSSIFVVQAAGQLQSKTDEIVIGAFLPVIAVTPYGIARRLSEVAPLLTRQFLKVLLPLASELDAQDDRRALRSLYLVATRLSLASFLPVGAGIVILARPLLSAWVGPEYADSATLVLILTTAALIDISQWPAGSVLQGMARHRVLAWFSIGSGLVNLALSLALVRPLGVMGVALGTLIPTAIESLLIVLPYTLRTLDVSAGEAFRQSYLPALLPAVPLLLVLVAVRALAPPGNLITIGLTGLFGAGVYGLAYFLLSPAAMERQLVAELARRALSQVRRRGP